MTKEEANFQKVEITKELVVALIAKGSIGSSTINGTFQSIYKMVDALVKED